jgi:hypothetical protein
MLMQEVAVTGALRRYAEQLREDARGGAEARQAFRIVAKAVGREECEFTPALFPAFAQKLAMRIETAKRTRPGGDWEDWGRNLYYAVTGIEADVAVADVRIGIEEAALSAVGRTRRKRRAK